MQFNLSNPFASKTYLRGFINTDLETIYKRIKILADKNSVEEDLILYYLVRTLLDKDMFFSLEEEIYKDLFFNAAYWASKTETKQKNRPKNFNGVGDKKIERYFTKLISAVMSALMKKHNISNEDIHNNTMNEIKFNLELSEYLNLMFEISCIKRNRNKSEKIN